MSSKGQPFLIITSVAFYNSNHRVTFFELQFVGTAACDGAFNEIVPDTDDYVCQDIAQLDFFDFSPELVSKLAEIGIHRL